MEPQKLVEDCFRHEAGKLTAYLIRVLGIHQLAIAEEIVQDTFLKALQVWPFHPPLDQPAAWLWRVAKNKAIDHMRRTQKNIQIQGQFPNVPPPFSQDELGWKGPKPDPAFSDELLRMMFHCCNDSLLPKDQVALCLHLVGGFSVKETAYAFMTSPGSMRKRLYRAKQTLRMNKQPFELPPEKDLAKKLDNILSVLYLMFNEGYFSHSEKGMIQKDLVAEALRLVGILVHHPRFRLPKALALAALMSFLAARIPGRINEDGCILLLEHQDRTEWDKRLIRQGLALMDECRKRSISYSHLSSYHFEASIAGLHCLAPSLAETDWKKILQLYTYLKDFNDSPLVELNRLIVLGQLESPETVLCQLLNLELHPEFEFHHYLYSVMSEFYLKAGNQSQALKYLEKAICLTKSPPQLDLLLAKKQHYLLGDKE